MLIMCIVHHSSTERVGGNLHTVPKCIHIDPNKAYPTIDVKGKECMRIFY